MSELVFSKEAACPLAERFFERIFEETLRVARRFSRAVPRKARVTAVAVTEGTIRTLNRRYRRHDRVTDILSFPGSHAGEASSEGLPAEVHADLGELYFSPRYIKRVALEDRVSFEREMTFVFSHGVLHLLGYDHEEVMFQIQDTVTDSLTGTKPPSKRMAYGKTVA